MSSGHWRGVTLAIALVSAFATGTGNPVSASGLIHKTIPREILAQDFRTGKVMMAPPVPYGCYVHEPFGVAKSAAGLTFGAIHGVAGHFKGVCSKCGNSLCGLCGGNGLFQGRACNSCGGDGCLTCGEGGLAGHGGLFNIGHGHEGVASVGEGSCSGIDGGCSLFGHHHAGKASVGYVTVAASAQVAPTAPSKTPGATTAQPQSFVAPVIASSQMPSVCGGCLGMGRTARGAGCGLCGGRGFLGVFANHGTRCGSCGGAGCNTCGGRGFLSGLGHGQGNSGVCSNCGGAGCALCGKGKSHLLALPHSLAGKILHKGDIKYFVGPGGPVPLTPGYVPYINPVRSPRDYFAFPPFSDQVP